MCKFLKTVPSASQLREIANRKGGMCFLGKKIISVWYDSKSVVQLYIRGWFIIYACIYNNREYVAMDTSKSTMLFRWIFTRTYTYDVSICRYTYTYTGHHHIQPI